MDWRERDTPLNERYDNDTYESWLDFETYLKQQQKTAEGHRNAYMPDPQDIQDRIRIMRMLEDIGLWEEAIDSIMYHDMPPYTLVLQLAERYSEREVCKRVHHFIGLME